MKAAHFHAKFDANYWIGYGGLKSIRENPIEILYKMGIKLRAKVNNRRTGQWLWLSW